MSKDFKSVAVNQNQILIATDRAKSLVGQIMTFSRDTNIGQKPTDLTVLLEETMKLVRVSIPSNIETVLKKGEGVQVVMGSAIQIQQIIMNLTTNAYQAMNSKGGSITIALELKRVSREKNLSHGVLNPGYYSALSVSDTGPGMSSEIASRVFEPYFTTKALGEGSGMGMAIVYKLAKAHGAMLDLKTIPGEGTSITLYFNELLGSNAEADVPDTEEAVPGSGERILLVDDEKGLLDAVQQLLIRIGYKVTAFSDPTAALEAFERSPEEFDVLVSDHSMPKITGIELLRKMRS